jgi:hypothetical protein
MLGAALASPWTPVRTATAEEPVVVPDAGDESRREAVHVVIAGSDEEAVALAESLRELVGRLGLRLQADRGDAPPWAADSRSAAGQHERARVWIDARPTDGVHVAISAARGGWFDSSVERVVPRGDAAPIVTERVAHVIHATLESLLAQSEPGASPSPVPPSTEGPSGASHDEAPQRRAAGLGLDAAFFASCRGLASSSGPVFGGGAALDVVARNVTLRPSLWLAGIVQESFDAQGQDMVLETSVASFRALPGVELLRLPVLDVDLGAGVGLDLFHVIPRDARRPSLQLESPTTQADPVLEGQLISRIRVARSARLLVGVQLDYDFGAHRYTAIDRFGNPQAVLEPWAARPAAILGFCIPFAGMTACSSSE